MTTEIVFPGLGRARMTRAQEDQHRTDGTCPSPDDIALEQWIERVEHTPAPDIEPAADHLED